MSFRMHKIQVWSAEIPDRAGAAAAKLELLARSGADLEFIYTQPVPGKPEVTAMFLAPINGPEQLEAARMAGLTPTCDIVMLCVEGDNQPGLGYQLMYRLAVAGLNLRSLSVSTVGGRFAAYMAFDSADKVTQAIQVLAGLQP